MATQSPADRGAWSGKLGFVLAAAGSAIGLGNIWRFPYMAAEGGGGAFVFIYLVCVLFIGVPVLFAELSLGRATKRNPVGAFKKLAPSSAWPVVGGLGVVAGFGILAFYSVIAGWTVGYLWMALTGTFTPDVDAAASGEIFGNFIGSAGPAIGLTALFLFLTVVVVRGGVSSGIERASKILMPVLLAVLIVLLIRSVTLPGGGAGVRYLISPDLSEVTPTVFITALGQALFSMSLGMGAMITYGSYFPDRDSLPFAGTAVALADMLIALLAGFVIFPALFSAGIDPGSGGPGLVFVVLPTVFAEMPAGGFFAVLFFASLSIAALTSTISLLEVVVAYFVDERGWGRHMAAWTVGAACFLVALPSALSQGANGWLTDFGWLDVQNIVWGNFGLSVGAILICVFVGWIWGTDRLLEHVEMGGNQVPARGLLAFLVKFVCPLAIAAVLAFIIVTHQFF
ncbi:MAG: sodium-dependent transporter [Gemmatimonadota bacterium]|jgi:NSS family neurotransmitter:Na+ symporter